MRERKNAKCYLFLLQKRGREVHCTYALSIIGWMEISKLLTIQHNNKERKKKSNITLGISRLQIYIFFIQRPKTFWEKNIYKEIEGYNSPKLCSAVQEIIYIYTQLSSQGRLDQWNVFFETAYFCYVSLNNASLKCSNN